MASLYEMVGLHERRDLAEECVSMLNKEWERSRGMRDRTIEQSNEEFPYNVVLLEKNGKGEDVVGHAKITKVLGNPKSLYISSVIIQEHLRGKGLGKLIMQMLEGHMKPRGITTFYLRTDIPDFYVKCGYQICDPVQEVTNPVMEDRIAKLDAVYGRRPKSCGAGNCNSGSDTTSEDNSVKELKNVRSSPAKISTSPPPAPLVPPPPPVPKSMAKKNCGGCKSSLPSCTAEDDCGEGECKYWMKKEF